MTGKPKDSWSRINFFIIIVFLCFHFFLCLVFVLHRNNPTFFPSSSLHLKCCTHTAVSLLFASRLPKSVCLPVQYFILGLVIYVRTLKNHLTTFTSSVSVFLFKISLLPCSVTTVCGVFGLSRPGNRILLHESVFASVCKAGLLISWICCLVLCHCSHSVTLSWFNLSHCIKPLNFPHMPVC